MTNPTLSRYGLEKRAALGDLLLQKIAGQLSEQEFVKQAVEIVMVRNPDGSYGQRGGVGKRLGRMAGYAWTKPGVRRAAYALGSLGALASLAYGSKALYDSLQNRFEDVVYGA